jgi:hypothetical protein
MSAIKPSSLDEPSDARASETHSGENVLGGRIGFPRNFVPELANRYIPMLFCRGAAT